MALRLTGALALGMLTTGCAALGQITAVSERIEEATAPVELYVLTPAETFAPGLPRIDYQVVVEEPLAASHLDTDLIALMPTPLSVEYLPVARWADRAPLLVQQLLVESLENAEKVASVTGQRVAVASDFFLFPDLRAFHAVAPPLPDRPPESDAPAALPAEAPLVQVELRLKLVEEASGAIVASEVFEGELAATSPEPLATVAAFDAVLDAVLTAAVEWTIREIAAWEPPADPFALEG